MDRTVSSFVTFAFHGPDRVVIRHFCVPSQYQIVVDRTVSSFVTFAFHHSIK